MSFQTRLILFFLLLVLVILGTTYWYYSSSINKGILKESKADAEDTLAVVGWLIQEHEPFNNRKEFDAWLTTLSSIMNIRITYILADGEVIADSMVPWEKIPAMDPHGKRPEVLQADDGDVGMSVRYSDTLSRDLLYAARRLEPTAGLPAGTLRVAVPMSLIKEQHNRLISRFPLIAGAAFLFSLLPAALFSRALTRSIEAFSKAAADIGSGAHSHRIRVFPGKEFQPLATAVNNMAADIEQRINTMEEQRGELEATFNGMRDGILVLDYQGRILNWNAAMLEMFPGLERYRGRLNMEAFMNIELRDAIRSLPQAAAGVERMRMKLNDREMEIGLSFYRDQRGIGKVVLVFRDVTELQRLERIRRDFVTNVSHELKTPITNIKGYAETLVESTDIDAGNRSRFLETIIKNADHMAKMIGKLLLLARIEHTSEQEDLREVSAAEALDEAEKLLAHLLTTKNITIERRLCDAADRVMADDEGLPEVFRNLLENAIKYGPENSTILVSSQVENNEALFSIEDNGPGLSNAHAERVFERFYRGGAATPSKEGSTGLGLAICRNILRNLGGRIRAEGRSDHNQGAAFRFTLKLPAKPEA